MCVTLTLLRHTWFYHFPILRLLLTQLSTDFRAQQRRSAAGVGTIVGLSLSTPAGAALLLSPARLGCGDTHPSPCLSQSDTSFRSHPKYLYHFFKEYLSLLGKASVVLVTWILRSSCSAWHCAVLLSDGARLCPGVWAGRGGSDSREKMSRPLPPGLSRCVRIQFSSTPPRNLPGSLRPYDVRHNHLVLKLKVVLRFLPWLLGWILG